MRKSLFQPRKLGEERVVRGPHKKQKKRIFGFINRNLDKLMNTKKLIVFLLWAFLPMVIVGLVMHFSGASA
ncbi:MAG: hypothetical protein II424_05535, partial [Bacteroidales bacterium]|nr:hypothetical protein [Bacteroidales bacterium]